MRRMGLSYQRELYVCISSNQWILKISLTEHGIGTKSQQVLKLQQEQNKLVRKERSKMEREAESDRLFELKQQKKKEKHKGH